jgi:hypothetical protein
MALSFFIFMKFTNDRQRRAAFANIFSVKSQNVSRGKRFEQKIHARLARSDSVVTMRSVGSRGLWDMVAITPTKVRLVQAKTHGYIEPEERVEMLVQLQHMPDNVQAELEYYISPRVTKNFTIKKAGEKDWEKVEERLDQFAKVRGYRKRSDDSKFSKLSGKLGKHEAYWRAETDTPPLDRTLDDPLNEESRFDIALTEMTPDDFLDTQFKQAEVSGGRPIDYDKWIRPSSFKLDRAVNIMKGEYVDPRGYYKSGAKLPLVYVEYGPEGELTGWQEGRHRALASKEMGLDMMPVLIAKRRE